MDWNKDVLKVEYSDTYDAFGDGGAVNVYRRHLRLNLWKLVLSDMSPEVLKMSMFPKRLVDAARKVVKSKGEVILNGKE